ncbi:MAG: radical SAM protein [Elusimicrobia bacterium]|nr:radical SAM protein [Elusimicrobiota bacterium]
MIGGAAVGINGREMLDFFDLELAVCGDGETAMVDLLDRWERGLALSGVSGLVIRREGRIIEENPPLGIKELDRFPRSRVHRYIDVNEYRRYDSPIQVQTKRGCALKCAYCTYNRIEGSCVRLRDPHLVADEVAEIVETTGVTHIEFTDSTFNIPLDHCKAVLRAIIQRGLSLRLRTMGINPGAVDEELVDLLRTAGFRDVDLGVESGCDKILKNLGKSFRKKDVLSAGRRLQQRGIDVTYCLLVGAPGETPETLRETFVTMDAVASPWNLIDVGVGLRIYKGSPIADEMLRNDPTCTADQFLRPVTYTDPEMDLNTLQLLTKWHAMGRINVFLYNDDQGTPPILLRLGTYLLKRFAPHRPLWKWFIIIRLLERWSGLNAVKQVIFYISHRKTLRRALAPPRRGTS